MLLLKSHFILPIYFLPILYYFLKFFFIFTVVLAVFMMICSSACAWRIQYNVSKLKFAATKNTEPKEYNDQQYTNTWVSFIHGDSYDVQIIARRHGYVVLDEVCFFFSPFLVSFPSTSLENVFLIGTSDNIINHFQPI